MDVLKHPFILLVIGAVLSGLIIPLITRNWQFRQKALEIKTTLVTEIGEAVMEFMMSIQFTHMRKELRKTSQTPISPEEQTEFDKAYKAWEVKSAVIGTKLQAYLPKSNIPKTWKVFSEVVTRFYTLEGVSEPQQLRGSMADLAKNISKMLSYNLPESANWAQLREAILECKSGIIRSVLHAKVSLN